MLLRGGSCDKQNSLSEQVDCMSECVENGTLLGQRHEHANKNILILKIFKSFLKTFKGKRTIIILGYCRVIGLDRRSQNEF